MILWYPFSTDISNLADILLDIHHVAPKWKDVGLLLRLHPSELELIEANHVKEGVTCCLRAVVDKWLKRSYDTATHGLPSWKLLVAAIAHPVGGNNPALAEEIATKHNGKYNNTVLNVFVHIHVYTCGNCTHCIAVTLLPPSLLYLLFLYLTFPPTLFPLYLVPPSPPLS